MTLEKAHERGTHLTCAKACFSWSSNVAANLKTSRHLNAKQPTISFIRSLFIYFNRDYSFAYRKIAFISVLDNYFDNKNRLVA